MYHDPLVTRTALPNWLVPIKWRRHDPVADSTTATVSACASAQSKGSGDDNETAFLRSANRPAMVSVWHGAIPSPTERNNLAADAIWLVDSVGSETFWVDASTPMSGARCTLERFALAVLRFHAGRDAAADDSSGSANARPCRFTGAEWWVQARRSDGPRPGIGFHWDSDEGHASSTGEHVPPWIATVTYLGVEGAPTLVLPVAADACGRGFPADGLSPTDGVAPTDSQSAARASGGCEDDPQAFGEGAYLSYPVAGKVRATASWPPHRPHSTLRASPWHLPRPPARR